MPILKMAVNRLKEAETQNHQGGVATLEAYPEIDRIWIACQ